MSYGKTMKSSFLVRILLLKEKLHGWSGSSENLSAARWPLARQPYLLETSLRWVFAVGDVRGGSIKRVASAVGEGSIVISLVHKILQE